MCTSSGAGDFAEKEDGRKPAMGRWRLGREGRELPGSRDAARAKSAVN